MTRPSTPLRPSDILSDDASSVAMPDGTVARKGTIKATIDNIALMDTLLTQPFDTTADQQMNETVAIIDELIPALKSLGLFEFFTIHEWLSDPTQKGRILVALRYLRQFLPTYDTHEQARIKMRLGSLGEQVEVAILIDSIDQTLSI